MSDISNNDDGTLLLELGVEADENSFDNAKRLLEDLRGDMEDFSMDLNLGDFLSGLRTAASVLKGIVDMWNALENKALDVSFSTNDYLPYNITPGQRQNIENRLNSSKVAAHFGLTPDNVLKNLENVILTQGQVKNLGKLNDEDATVLQELGDLLNNPQLQGDNLSHFFTDNTTSYVYETITGALADAYRLAYSKPEGSSERQRILEYIKNVEKTPFVSPEVSKYIAFMTEPNSPDYAHSGNPIYRFFNSGVEDEGVYMDKLNKAGVRASANAEDLGVTKSEIKEALDNEVLTLYNILAESVVLPLTTTVQSITDVLSKKKMNGASSLEAFDLGVLTKFNRWATGASNVTLGAIDKSLVGGLASHFGLSSNWVENQDMGARVQAILSGMNSNDPLSTELTFYELMRLGSTNYEDTAKDVTAYAIEQIGAKYGKTEFKGKKSTKDLNTAVAQSMMDPNSRFYVGSGGFLEIYEMLYRNEILSEKAFLDTMGEAFKNTKMKELGNYYGYQGATDITDYRVVKEKDGTFKLEVTIKDTKTGEVMKDTYTSDELVNGIKANF